MSKKIRLYEEYKGFPESIEEVNELIYAYNDLVKDFHLCRSRLYEHPWSNTGCLGYAYIAKNMIRHGHDFESAFYQAFDEFTISEAENYYLRKSK